MMIPLLGLAIQSGVIPAGSHGPSSEGLLEPQPVFAVDTFTGLHPMKSYQTSNHLGNGPETIIPSVTYAVCRLQSVYQVLCFLVMVSSARCNQLSFIFEKGRQLKSSLLC